MITFVTNSLGEGLLSSSENALFGWTFIFGVLITALVFYFFMSYAFFRMAKKRDVENAYLAFIPFVRYLIAGKVIGKISFFGKVSNKIGMITMISIIVSYVLRLFFFIFNYYLIFCAIGTDLPIEIDLFLGMEGYIIGEHGLIEWIAAEYPTWLTTFYNILSTLYTIFNFAYIFVIFTFWNGLFAKFKPGMSIMYAIIATLFSLSPILFPIPIEIGGLFAFIFRNRDDVKINIYANPYGGYGGYQGGYGSQDPYGRPSAPKSNEENPFGEFDNENSSSSNDDPFDLN